MVQTLKMKGKTVDEAVDSALKVLKVTKDKVSINVLVEPESGVLGVFGGKMAEVEISVIENEADMGKRVLQEILDRMGFLTLIDLVGQEVDSISLEIKGEDMGRIIGKEGATLDALQIITGNILGRKFGKRMRVYIEAQGYRRKRQQRIEQTALEAAERAIAENKPIKLEPMTPADRRMAHLALQGNSNVDTHSEGELVERRVVVSPKGLNPQSINE